jgi:N6-adenosine-specific RNA methylase IME4
MNFQARQLQSLRQAYFGAILIDAPTRCETYSRATAVTARGSATKAPTVHYPTMTFKEIAALPVGDLAAEHCALFLWTCWPMLQQSLALIERWGFVYKTAAFDWMKLQKSKPAPIGGMGYWTRSNTEPCLLATRGHPKSLNADVPQAVLEPRREHSRKPDCIHARIERLVAGPYLELFARQTRPGWTSWGNEVTKFNTDGGIAARAQTKGMGERAPHGR